MADYDDNPYNNNDTVGDAFSTPSTIEYPDMRHGADVPGMPFTAAPDCAYGGWGTGGETLEKDGEVTTRYKGHTTTAAIGSDGGTVI